MWLQKLLVSLGLIIVPPPPKPILPVPTQRQLTIQFAEKAMARAKLSPTRLQLLTQMLVEISLKAFNRQDHREYWIALIGAESGYDGANKSSAGAVGLGQLLPAYRNDFGRACGLGDLADSDLRDDYVNASLSACWFRHLIDQTGSVPMALVSYNAGQHSHARKAAKLGAAMNAETANYATKIWISREGR